MDKKTKAIKVALKHLKGEGTKFSERIKEAVISQLEDAISNKNQLELRDKKDFKFIENGNPNPHFHDYLTKSILDYSAKKMAHALKVLKEKTGIEIIQKEEAKKRFKSILIEQDGFGGEERYYFNNGTPEGLLIVTYGPLQFGPDDDLSYKMHQWCKE